MTPQTAQKLLEQNRELYNKVAKEFAETRERKFDQLIPLGQYAKEGNRVLDAGSGSGRLFNVFRDRRVQYFGIDASEELTRIAKEKWKSYSQANFQVGNLLAIPFPDAYFDAVYSIAALHHIPSRELRLKALSEFYRVLKPGGKFIMMNWYYWRGPAVLIIIKYWLLKLLSPLIGHSNILQNVGMTADLDFGDIFVRWGKQGLRYYHSFRKQELEKLLKQVGFKKIEQRLIVKTIGNHWSKRVNLVTIAQN